MSDWAKRRVQQTSQKPDEILLRKEQLKAKRDQDQRLARLIFQQVKDALESRVSEFNAGRRVRLLHFENPSENEIRVSFEVGRRRFLHAHLAEDGSLIWECPGMSARYALDLSSPCSNALISDGAPGSPDTIAESMLDALMDGEPA